MVMAGLYIDLLNIQHYKPRPIGDIYTYTSWPWLYNTYIAENFNIYHHKNVMFNLNLVWLSQLHLRFVVKISIIFARHNIKYLINYIGAHEAVS